MRCRRDRPRKQDGGHDATASFPLWDLFGELSGLRVIYAAANALGICRLDPPRPILALDDAGHLDQAMAQPNALAPLEIVEIGDAALMPRRILAATGLP
jgi:hypothetical protein